MIQLEVLEGAPSPGGPEHPQDRDRHQRRPPEIGLHIPGVSPPAGLPELHETVSRPAERERRMPYSMVRISFPAQRAPAPGNRTEQARTYRRCSAMLNPRRSRSSLARIPFPTCARHALQMSVASRLPTIRVAAPQTADAVHPDLPGEKFRQTAQTNPAARYGKTHSPGTGRKNRSCIALPGPPVPTLSAR